METLRIVVLTAHALCATGALVASVVVILRGRGIPAHMWLTAAMLVTLMWSMALGWGDFEAASKVAFSGLALLAVYMLARAWNLHRMPPQLRTHGREPTPACVEAIGFNLISYVVAGTVVPVLRSGAGPIWLIVDIVVCIAVMRAVVQRRLSQVEAPRPEFSDAPG